MGEPFPPFDEREILNARPPKHLVDEDAPVGYFVEPERDAAGTVALTATVLLANRECPFRCLMCDLWKFTTDHSVAPGSIPRQIDVALRQLPDVRRIKLYNAGNFFDTKAIPQQDWQAIAHRVSGFDRVIVENHPRLTDSRALAFRGLLTARFEVALGLETTHPGVLRALNKRMTVDDYRRAAGFLADNGISVRTFLLAWPPFLGEEEGIEWTHHAIRVALDAGSETVSLVPLRPGNGLMDRLFSDHLARSPSLSHLEQIMERELPPRKGTVFVDLWDAESLIGCARCGPARIARLRSMNLTQQIPASVNCTCSPRSIPDRSAWTPSRRMF